MRRASAIDLFCGCGGLTVGLKQAGFGVIGAVEIDPLAAGAYRMNHRRTVVWETDIQELDVANVKRLLDLREGDLDLLAGCPPCEGFSSLRTLNGSRVTGDPRNDLVFEFLRFAKGLRPKAIMIENVPGLAGDWRMNSLRRGLSRMGYICNLGVLDAADYGVPQRRRRLLLLGSRGVAIAFPEPARTRRTVRDAIGSLPRCGTSGDPLHDLRESRSARIVKMIAKIPADGGSRVQIGEKYRLECHRRCDGFSDVYGRMAWDKVAPTITGGCVNPSKGRFLHPSEHRAITLREAALLQTFPIDYRFPLKAGKYAVAALIGNALPPEFIRHHALEVRQHLALADR